MPLYHNKDIERVEETQRRFRHTLQIVEAQLPQMRRTVSAIPVRLSREFRASRAGLKRRLRTAVALVQEMQRTTKR